MAWDIIDSVGERVERFLEEVTWKQSARSRVSQTFAALRLGCTALWCWLRAPGSYPLPSAWMASSPSGFLYTLAHRTCQEESRELRGCERADYSPGFWWGGRLRLGGLPPVAI